MEFRRSKEKAILLTKHDLEQSVSCISSIENMANAINASIDINTLALYRRHLASGVVFKEPESLRADRGAARDTTPLRTIHDLQNSI
jgi:hypothetical protein